MCLYALERTGSTSDMTCLWSDRSGWNSASAVVLGPNQAGTEPKHYQLFLSAKLQWQWSEWMEERVGWVSGEGWKGGAELGGTWHRAVTALELYYQLGLDGREGSLWSTALSQTSSNLIVVKIYNVYFFINLQSLMKVRKIRLHKDPLGPSSFWSNFICFCFWN